MFLILDKILIIDVPCSWLKIREWLSEYFFFAKVCDKHNISVNCNNLDQIYSIWTFIIKASFHKISFSQNERLIISEFLIRHDLPEKLEAACGRRPQRPQVCRPLWYSASKWLNFVCLLRSNSYKIYSTKIVTQLS